MIVRGAVDMEKTTEGPKFKDHSPALGRIGSTLPSGTVSKSVEPWYCLYQIFLTFHMPGECNNFNIYIKPKSYAGFRFIICDVNRLCMPSQSKYLDVLPSIICVK